MNIQRVGLPRSVLIWLGAELREAQVTAGAVDAAVSRLEPDRSNYDSLHPSPTPRLSIVGQGRTECYEAKQR